MRDQPVRLMLRVAEKADLIDVGREWGIPLATVAWVILHDRIARWRRMRPHLGDECSIALAGAFDLARSAGMLRGDHPLGQRLGLGRASMAATQLREIADELSETPEAQNQTLGQLDLRGFVDRVRRIALHLEGGAPPTEELADVIGESGHVQEVWPSDGA